MWLRSANKSSTISLRWDCSFGVSVRTTIPSSTGVRHDACEFLLAFDFDQAEAARADIAEAADMAKARDVDAVVPRYGEDGLRRRGR